MLLLALCATLLLLSSSGSARVQAAASSEAASDVVLLTDSNFDELTATGSWIIEFYGGAHTRTMQEATGGMRTGAHIRLALSLLSHSAAPWCGQSPVASQRALNSLPQFTDSRSSASLPLLQVTVRRWPLCTRQPRRV